MLEERSTLGELVGVRRGLPRVAVAAHVRCEQRVDPQEVARLVGGIDPATYEKAKEAGKLDELPANHAPNFAPVIDPTLRTGVEAMLAAAGAWICPAAASVV